MEGWREAEASVSSQQADGTEQHNTGEQGDSEERYGNGAGQEPMADDQESEPMVDDAESRDADGQGNHEGSSREAGWEGRAFCQLEEISSASPSDEDEPPGGAHNNEVELGLRRALLYAVARNDKEKVRELLHEGVDVDSSYYGRHALCVAAQEGHTDMAHLLMDAGCSIHLADPSDSMWQRQAIHLAAAKGHLDIVRHLVDAGVSVNVGDSDGRTPLHWSATSGWVPVAQYLLQQGAGVNQAQKDGFSPLHAATYLGHMTMCRFLLEQGADINQADNDGWACLQAATCYGHPDLVHLFIKAGAHVNHKTTDNETALHVAVDAGDLVLVALLVNAGADLEARGINGLTALFAAVWRNRFDIARYLIDMGASVGRLLNNAGHTMVYIASIRAQVHFLDLLISAGADLQVENWLRQKHFPIPLGRNKEVCDWLIRKVSEPQTLHACCRSVIRANIRRPISESSHRLPLPSRLQLYISTLAQDNQQFYNKT